MTCSAPVTGWMSKTLFFASPLLHRDDQPTSEDKYRLPPDGAQLHGSLTRSEPIALAYPGIMDRLIVDRGRSRVIFKVSDKLPHFFLLCLGDF